MKKNNILKHGGLFEQCLYISLLIVRHLFDPYPSRWRDESTSGSIFQLCRSIHDPERARARATPSGNITDKFNAQLLDNGGYTSSAFPCICLLLQWPCAGWLHVPRAQAKIVLRPLAKKLLLL